MKRILVYLCVFLYPTILFSSEKVMAMAINSKPSEDELNAQIQAKAIMNSIYDSYLKITPYLYSTKNVFSQFEKTKIKEKEELLKNLNDLSFFLKSANHAEFLKRPGFKPSLEVITDHLDETILSIEAESFLFAQKRLNVLGSICITCHSQLPESVSSNAFKENIQKLPREKFDSDFSFANYLYLVRRFDDAKIYFEKTIEGELKGSHNYSQDIRTSLRLIISIYTKIKFDYKIANSFIEKWVSNSKLTSTDRRMIERWKESLKKWKDFNPKAIKSLPLFIKNNLSPLDLKKELIFSGEEDVTLLISSGVLLNYLVESPNSVLAPEILYWLSQAELRMGRETYFFSLGDIYLKDCIRRYPSSPYAKKCFQEYSDSIEAGFTGSGGVDIPIGEQRELAKLKKLLKP